MGSIHPIFRDALAPDGLEISIKELPKCAA